MVGNSMDGNLNGTAEGPAGTAYYLNMPPEDLEGYGDNVRYLYHIGSDIDLEPPIILDITPKSTAVEGDYPEGSENVPPEAPIEITWSKVMSASSMRGGSYNEGRAEEDSIFTTEEANLAIRSRELDKMDRAETCETEEGSCETEDLDPPYFYAGLGDGPIEVNGEEVSRMVLDHRDFMGTSDLGWSEAEILAHPEYIPIYQPVVGSKVRDARQNCFYPSDYSACVEDGRNSCCNRIGVNEYTCEFNW
jgi:hypothetical protein